MDNKQIPLSINKNRTFYSDFGSRLGAGLLDGLIMSPIIILTMIINSQNMNMQYCTLFMNLVFGLWYMVYLPKRYGGTPGKLVAGLKIIKMDGSDIDWKEAFLRYSVSIAISVISALITVYTLIQADAETYDSMDWMEQAQYLQSFASGWQLFFGWVSGLWILAEIITYFANDRSRPVHDMIAGTVVIKKDYDKMVKEFMAGEPETPVNVKHESTDFTA